MKLNSMIKFFEHIATREQSYGVEDGFRFKAVLSSRKKGSIHPAKYKTLHGGSDDDDESALTQTNIRQQRPRTSRPEGTQVYTGLMTPACSQLNTGLRTPADSPAPRQPRTLDNSLNESQSASSRRHSTAQEDANPTSTPVSDPIHKQNETRSRLRSSNLQPGNGGS
jgi:hypothetical protein